MAPGSGKSVIISILAHMLTEHFPAVTVASPNKFLRGQLKGRYFGNNNGGMISHKTMEDVVVSYLRGLNYNGQKKDATGWYTFDLP